MKFKFFTWLACSTLLVGGCFMSRTIDAEELTTKDFAYDNFHTAIEGRLYRSGQIPAARLTAYLNKFGIKTIINLRSKAERMVCCRGEEDAAKAAGAFVQYAPMSAGRASTRKEVLALLKIFDTAQEPILIHCSQGINRTGEACALWCLEKMHMTNDDALKQFDSKFGYVLNDRPEKFLFIKAWQGREWLEKIYNPETLSR